MSLNNTQNNTNNNKKIKITKTMIINNLRKTIKRQNKKMEEQKINFLVKTLYEKNKELDELKKQFNQLLFLIEGCNTEEKLNLLKEIAKRKIK